MEDSLKADAWSLSKLAGYKEGKILVWAWVSRGFVTMQQVAEWRFGGDVGQAKEFLDSTPHELAKLTELDEIEEPDAPAETKAVVQAETSTMQGEINSLWAISDPDLPEHPPKLLPQWFVPPIDRAILMWKQEAMVWEQRKQKKMSPKMTEAYAQWQSDSTRSIVLNKKTKSQMHRFLGKSVSSLKRTCLLLVVHMSNQPEELRINAGSGKAWRLSLLQGTMPPSDDAVPPELDHFQGKLPPEQDPVSDVENDEAAAADIQQMQMVADSDHEGEDLHPDMVPYMFVETGSESEEEVPAMFAKAQRVRCLESQPEYQRLRDLGLATRPFGCSVGCHPAARVYRASSADSSHFSRSWDGDSGRNAWQALLCVMELMLKSHLESNSQDRLARRQLAKIQSLRANEPPHSD